MCKSKKKKKEVQCTIYEFFIHAKREECERHTQKRGSHLDTGRAALANSIRYSGTRRINHGHEADEAKVVRLEVDVISVEGKSLGVLVLWQQQVAETWRTNEETAQCCCSLTGSEGPTLHKKKI